jgi:hypothetical protein
MNHKEGSTSLYNSRLLVMAFPCQRCSQHTTQHARAQCSSDMGRRNRIQDAHYWGGTMAGHAGHSIRLRHTGIH